MSLSSEVRLLRQQWRSTCTGTLVAQRFVHNVSVNVFIIKCVNLLKIKNICTKRTLETQFLYTVCYWVRFDYCCGTKTKRAVGSVVLTFSRHQAEVATFSLQHEITGFTVNVVSNLKNTITNNTTEMNEFKTCNHLNNLFGTYTTIPQLIWIIIFF